MDWNSCGNGPLWAGRLEIQLILRDDFRALQGGQTGGGAKPGLGFGGQINGGVPAQGQNLQTQVARQNLRGVTFQSQIKTPAIVKLVVKQLAVQSEARHIANVMYPQERIQTQIQMGRQGDFPNGGVGKIGLGGGQGNPGGAMAQQDFSRGTGGLDAGERSCGGRDAVRWGGLNSHENAVRQWLGDFGAMPSAESGAGGRNIGGLEQVHGQVAGVFRK